LKVEEIDRGSAFSFRTLPPLSTKILEFRERERGKQQPEEKQQPKEKIQQIK